MANKDVQNYLNKIVATQGLFYIRLHQFHWYVKGPQFYALHVKFEELYDEVTADMDAVAERLLAIGGEPYATLEEFQKHSIIEEFYADKDLSEEKMVKALIINLQEVRDSLQEGIALTDKNKDYVSNDLLIGIKASIDKHIWMLQACLGNKPLAEID